MISFLFVLFWILFTTLFSIYVNQSIGMIILWFVLGFIASFFAVIIVLLLHFPYMHYTKVTDRYKYYLSRSTSHWLIKFFMRLKITIIGKENIPKDGLLTVYANHKSYADPFIMFEIMKRPTTFTPKMGVYKLPLIHNWLNFLGAFPIDRSSDRNTAKAMVNAIKVVKQGMAMAIFPEGGIKDRDDERMVAMRAGAYRLAVKAGANLLPVSISGTSEIKKRAPFRSTKIRVLIHPLVEFEKIKHMNTTEIADMMFKIINTKL
jgi:1-acyl-sn-glycerol-3-phosphate acyltransferase